MANIKVWRQFSFTNEVKAQEFAARRRGNLGAYRDRFGAVSFVVTYQDEIGPAGYITPAEARKDSEAKLCAAVARSVEHPEATK